MHTNAHGSSLKMKTEPATADAQLQTDIAATLTSIGQDLVSQFEQIAEQMELIADEFLTLKAVFDLNGTLMHSLNPESQFNDLWL